MKKTIVVGGGAAGLISAYFRAISGDEVVLIERNEKLGKKLYITGKGRCNVTNNCNKDEFLSNVVTNPKFLLSSISRFTPEEFMAFLEKKVRLKTERGNRVFPASDKASDITKALENYCSDAGVNILLNERVIDIIANNGRITSVITQKNEYKCDNVILCTGGKSYPSTGSTGDGYVFAQKMGHTVIPLKPALCGFNLKGDFYKNLQGVNLKNIRFTVKNHEKTVYTDFGEALFTHFGISGPVVISASGYLNKCDLSGITFSIDLKPALTGEQLDARILRDFATHKGKTLQNSLDNLLLHSLIPVILRQAGVDGNIKNAELNKSARLKIVDSIKNFEFYPSSLRGIEEAIVTSGGVSVKEINPVTMESKLIKGLYFAGEVIDVDALTGGFNITIAACTAHAAGTAKEL